MIESEVNSDSRLVAFIDDEGGPMDWYEDELRFAHYRVKRIKSVVQALDYISTTEEPPDLWLVDLMMPVQDANLKVDGKLLMEEAKEGLACGPVIYQQIRKRFPTVPVILLTAVATPEILDAIEQKMDENAWCESKMARLPSEIASLVTERIAQHGQGSKPI